MTLQAFRAIRTVGLGIVLTACANTFGAEVVEVRPAAQTTPSSPVGDADDVCVWIHPTDPALSVVIGTDKERGLDVYDLDGRQIQHVERGHMNNVDIRYNFPLGGQSVDLIAASNKDKSHTIVLYSVDPETRQLVDVAARPLPLDMDAYGLCMFHNLESGKFFVVVNSYGGNVEQWEIRDNGEGKVDGKRVRQFHVGSRTEGCVCDDEYGVLYIGEENVAIWKYPADPNGRLDPPFRQIVDVLGPKGHLSDDLNHDIEGLALYHGRDGTGYLLASCQGAGVFSVYRREGDHAYLGTFRVGGNAAKGIDDVSNTDGIDVTAASLGSLFPNGLFVAHDGANSDGDETNFKFVAWEQIAKAFTPSLQINADWNPRKPTRRR